MNEGEDDHDFLLGCLRTTLEENIERQRAAAAAGDWEHPNLRDHPDVLARFLRTFDEIREETLVLARAMRYTEAERVAVDMKLRLWAIAGEIHPDGCLETDAAAQWLTSVYLSFPPPCPGPV